MRSEMCSEGNACAIAEDDEAARRNMASVGEIRETSDGVGCGRCLGGMSAGGAAKAAVIESEDVDACGVEGIEGWQAIGERAVAVVEIEDRVVCVRSAGACGDPPAVELGLAVVIDVEVGFVEGQAAGCGSSGEGARRMEEKLPLTLVEEQAEGGVSAEGGKQKRQREASRNPTRAHVIGSAGLWWHNFLAKGEFIRRFERRAANATDDGRTVAANEGIVDGPRADGTPEFVGSGSGGGLRRIRRRGGHSEMSVALCIRRNRSGEEAGRGDG